jgi:replicative DNA helicase
MAQVDLTCLRILREREDYDRLRRIIPEALLDPATDTILKDYGRYFKDNPDEERINLESFKSMFFGFWHPKLSPEQKTHYSLVLKQALKESVPDSIRQNFVSNIVEQDYAAKMAELLTKYNDGGDVNITREIAKLVEKAELDLEKKSDIQFVDDDIGDLLSADEDVRGVRWRLRCLQESIRPMASGDFGLVCGRPDTGKTTFLTDNLTYMAPQLPEAFPDREEPFILWLNNEGPGRRIKPRLYQSAVGLSLPECVALHKKGKLVDAYVKAVGALNRIRILDIHGWNHYDVEDVIKQTRPCIIVFDMIDNIRFAGMAQGSRTDQALEAMYQEAREWCVKYDAIGLATSQISNEGDGLLFPTISMLKDSKTGKQGAVDFQIMIGRSNDFNSESLRGIGVVKNKLRVPGMPGDPRAEVFFDGNGARYMDAD